MPKVLSHTPAWLARPAAGHQIFQPTETAKASKALSAGSGKKIDQTGPTRTIAQRGTELFFVSGNEIRWTDLVALKDAAEQGEAQANDEDVQKLSRVLKTSVAGQIRQLVLSPLGEYLAIATSHTVHIAILPARFDAPNTGPIRIRTFQLGPTAHVLEQAPVASLLWHPLGVLGSCLVTVTTDACVRLWELNRESRQTFDEPALAVDLKKLANATSSGEDLRASVYGTSKGFSPDSVEMEVAAACFGGNGSPDEHGWWPMTLWVAMTEGDVYALCPLLPKRFQPSTSTIPSLTTAVLAKAAVTGVDSTTSDLEKQTSSQQQKWLSDIDAQEPVDVSVPASFEVLETYTRPSNSPAIPRLQGPFRLSPEPDMDLITDIIAIAPRVDDDSLLDEDGFNDEPLRSGCSIGLICLLTTAGTIHVCLDLNDVEASWLPSKKGAFRRPHEIEDVALDLLLLESINLGPQSSGSSKERPLFTPYLTNRYAVEQQPFYQDPALRYSFHVTMSSGVYSCALMSWVDDIEDELSSPTDSGTGFRVGVLYESAKTDIVKIMTFSKAEAYPMIPACVSIMDSDLSHFVCTTCNNQPYAAILDLPIVDDAYEPFVPDRHTLALPAPESREAYHPPSAFYDSARLSSAFQSLLDPSVTRLKKADMKTGVRLSPATLQLLTEAHRVMSGETHRLGVAAADLFRRCERMRLELAEQVRKLGDAMERIERVTGQDEEGDEDGVQQKIDRRINQARDKDDQLRDRVEALRKRMAGLNGTALSKKEEAWAGEVRSIDDSLGGDGEEVEGRVKNGDSPAPAASLQQRLDAVSKMREQLVAQAKEATQQQQQQSDQADGEEEDEKRDRRSSRVPVDFRKQKMQQVMDLLERETALVDAVTDRLGKLTGLGV